MFGCENSNLGHKEHVPGKDLAPVLASFVFQHRGQHPGFQLCCSSRLRADACVQVTDYRRVLPCSHIIVELLQLQPNGHA